MALEHDIDSPFAMAVRVIGSQSATARLIGKSQASVHGRLKSGKPVWDDSVLKIAKASGIPKERLRPDLYGNERTPEPSASDILDRAAAQHDRAPASMEWKR